MNLMKYRFVFVGIFLLTMIAGVVAWLGFGLNPGVDFTGGTVIRFPVKHAITTAQVEKALSTPEIEAMDLKLSAPQPYDYIDSKGNQRYGVKVMTRFLNKNEQTVVVNALEKTFGSAEKAGGLDVYGVDPFMGKEMVNKTIWAVLISCLLILIYVGFRFEFKSGVAGVVALAHDVIVITGVFAIMHKEIDSTFVAAILTIIGYSINDTIVVFDRIRENMGTRRRGEGFDTLVNNSILQTLRRSLATGFTTMLATMSLYLLGSPSIKNFCLAMIIGITSGTYSSIFVASPIWAVWKNWEEKRKLGGKVAVAEAK
jgi:preprotein translocase subunit SecF